MKGAECSSGLVPAPQAHSVPLSQALPHRPASPEQASDQSRLSLCSYSSGGEDGYVRIHYFDPQYFEFEFEA